MANTVTPKQLFEFGKQVAERLGKIDADKDLVQTAIESGGHPFWAEVDKHFAPKDIASFENQLTSWKDFYWKHFGLALDLTGIKIPVHVTGFDRLIVIPQGITMNKVVETMRKHFGVSLYTEDLDTAVPTNDRDPKNGTYTVFIRDRVEADEELKNLSADNLTNQNIKGITLLERLLFELKYFSETGKHLDIKSWTLCSGSRDSDGRVPYVFWNDDELYIYWHCRDDCLSSLRSRAVSL